MSKFILAGIGLAAALVAGVHYVLTYEHSQAVEMLTKTWEPMVFTVGLVWALAFTNMPEPKRF